MTRLRRLYPPTHERPTDADARLRTVESQVAPLESQQLGYPKPGHRKQSEHRPVPRMNYGENGGELLARQGPDLPAIVVRHPLTVRKRSPDRRVVPYPPLPDRRREARADRVERVPDGRIGEPARCVGGEWSRHSLALVIGAGDRQGVRMLGLSAAIPEPREEPRDVSRRYLGQSPSALIVEEREREVAQEPTIFVAGRLPEATTTGALVALKLLAAGEAFRR